MDQHLHRGKNYETVESIGLATDALRKGELERAEQLCAVALAADDRFIEPLAIKAAMRKHRHRIKAVVSVVLMRQLAEKRCTADSFDVLMASYLRSIPVAA